MTGDSIGDDATSDGVALRRSLSIDPDEAAADMCAPGLGNASARGASRLTLDFAKRGNCVGVGGLLSACWHATLRVAQSGQNITGAESSRVVTSSGDAPLLVDVSNRFWHLKSSQSHFSLSFSSHNWLTRCVSVHSAARVNPRARARPSA